MHWHADKQIISKISAFSYFIEERIMWCQKRPSTNCSDTVSFNFRVTVNRWSIFSQNCTQEILVFIATLRLRALSFPLPIFVSPSLCVRLFILILCISFSYTCTSFCLQQASVKPIHYYSRNPWKHHPRTIQLLTMSTKYTHTYTHTYRSTHTVREITLIFQLTFN